MRGSNRSSNYLPVGILRQFEASDHLPKYPTPRQALTLRAAQQQRSPLPSQYVAGTSTLCFATPQFPYKKDCFF
jgi:hypothetical protein